MSGIIVFSKRCQIPTELTDFTGELESSKLVKIMLLPIAILGSIGLVTFDY